jgi:hypothetical protein
MSNAPIQSFPPATSESLANVNRPLPDSQNNSASGATTEVTTRASGSAPLQDTSTNKVVVSSYELPEDVVEVHQDPDIRGQIIIQYLDPSNNVVLQVPSTEELSVERGIAQEFQQAAKLRESESAAVPRVEGDHHGD